jgi:hypothetical protein
MLSLKEEEQFKRLSNYKPLLLSTLGLNALIPHVLPRAPKGPKRMEAKALLKKKSGTIKLDSEKVQWFLEGSSTASVSIPYSNIKCTYFSASLPSLIHRFMAFSTTSQPTDI